LNDNAAVNCDYKDSPLTMPSALVPKIVISTGKKAQMHGASGS